MKLKRRVDTVAHLYESGFRTLQVTGEGHVQALEARIALLEAAIREGLDSYIGEGYLDTVKLYAVLQEQGG